MKKNKGWLGLCLAAALALGLAACGGQADVASSTSEAQLPQVSGLVLDATEDTLILRTDGGMEYVMDLYGADIQVEGGLAAGMQVDVAYTGQLSQSGPHARASVVTPGQATAADALHTGCTVDGSVLETGDGTLTVRTGAGKEHTFATTKGARFAVHQWVRVTFDGDLAAGAASVVVQDVEPCTQLPDCYQMPVTLRRYEQETDTLRFVTQAGEEYEEDLAYVETDVPGGFDERTPLTAYYQVAGQPEEDGPVPIRLLKVEDARMTGESRLYATVESWDEDRGELVVHTLDGRVLTFWLYLRQLDEESAQQGLRPGDGICFYYSGALAGTDLSDVEVSRAERTAKAAEHRSSLAGEVASAGSGRLTLEAEDGRRIRFTRTESADSLPEGLAEGDWVRVEFTGWLGDGEDDADASRAELARVALAGR